MAKPLEGINPNILKWARERSGYTIEDVALALKREIKEVENWELGIEAPTYSQLEKLSYQLYKRPLAVFFFLSPLQKPIQFNHFGHSRNLNLKTFGLIPSIHLG